MLGHAVEEHRRQGEPPVDGWEGRDAAGTRGEDPWGDALASGWDQPGARTAPGGTTVTAGAETARSAPAPAAPAPAQPAPAAQAPAATQATDEGAYVTPLVRKLAAEHAVDLASVKGTGVGGRIRKQDVLDAAEAAKAPAAPA
ncbi:E3 binding domain-containing protein, partial [Streptomyces sp. Act-28]